MAHNQASHPTTDLLNPDLPPGLYRFVPDRPIPAPQVRTAAQRKRDRRAKLTRAVRSTPRTAQMHTRNAHLWVSASAHRSVAATGIALMLIISIVASLAVPDNSKTLKKSDAHQDKEITQMVIDPQQCELSPTKDTAICALN